MFSGTDAKNLVRASVNVVLFSPWPAKCASVHSNVFNNCTSSKILKRIRLLACVLLYDSICAF